MSPPLLPPGGPRAAYAYTFGPRSSLPGSIKPLAIDSVSLHVTNMS